jgi:hypothetical protein
MRRIRERILDSLDDLRSGSTKVQRTVSQGVQFDVEDYVFDADGPDWAGHRVDSVRGAVVIYLGGPRRWNEFR